MTIRQEIEQREAQLLSPFAALSSKTRGRKKPETECDFRTAFQRDRDKIIHTKAFRRLKHKTQVFISPIEDHYRTRLTHTLEVAQIGRTIARALRLNEDLAEAIALGHDLGHTPFGHSGEEVLDKMLKQYNKRFQHQEQSLRVVEILEKEGKGLNLTWEVKDGILHHPQKDKIKPATLEGKIIRLSDHLAYINHDIEDSIRAGIIKADNLPKNIMKILGPNILDTMIADIINSSLNKPEILMSKKIEEAMNALYDFLYDNVYLNPIAKSEEIRTNHLIVSLFRHYMDHAEELAGYKKTWDAEKIIQTITDFIASMTDRYAINKYTELFVPDEWRGKNK